MAQAIPAIPVVPPTRSQGDWLVLRSEACAQEALNVLLHLVGVDRREPIDAFAASDKCRIKVYADARSFLANYDPAGPEALVIDLSVVGQDGNALLAWLAAQSELPPTLVVGDATDVDLIVWAIKLGAADFLKHPLDPLAAIDRVERLCDQAHRAAKDRAKLRGWRKAAGSMSKRECAVLVASAEGATTKTVSRLLGVGIRTAHIHRTNAMRKLGVETPGELLDASRYLRDHGHVGDPDLERLLHC